MVGTEIRDGDRIASLLRAEIEGFEDAPFGEMTVEEATDGERRADELNREVFGVQYRGDALFEVVIQEERALLEFRSHNAAVGDAAREEGLRVRPKATDPPRTLVFVERGADVKRVIDVLRACLPPQ